MKPTIAIIIAVCLTGCFSKRPVNNGLEGTVLPAFNLLLVDSTTWFNTANVPTNKPTALFLYTPYCPYCNAQVKEIIQNMDRFKDWNLYAITTYPLKDIKNFYEKYELNKYQNFIVGRDTADFASNFFKNDGVPFIAIYNKQKKLSHSYIGQTDIKQILSSGKDE